MSARHVTVRMKRYTGSLAKHWHCFEIWSVAVVGGSFKFAMVEWVTSKISFEVGKVAQNWKLVHVQNEFPCYLFLELLMHLDSWSLSQFLLPKFYHAASEAHCWTWGIVDGKSYRFGRLHVITILFSASAEYTAVFWMMLTCKWALNLNWGWGPKWALRQKQWRKDCVFTVHTLTML